MVVEEDDEQSSDELEDADADQIEDEEAALAADDEDEGDETSLDELLAQRTATRKGNEEVEEEEDIMALASEKDTSASATLPSKVIPIKDQQEFVCRSCHLVKARSQLADAERMYCRDCA